MSSPSLWCRLTRTGGSETDARIPTEFQLVDAVTFFGRFPVLDPPARVDASIDTSLYSFHKWKEYISTTADNAKNIRLFSHESQLVIPCLFVSATHFAIRVENNRKTSGSTSSAAIQDIPSSPPAKEQPRFYLKDYSRNGTYINTTLVGQDKEVELFFGDEISVKFKAEIKLIYKFIPENGHKLSIGHQISIGGTNNTTTGSGSKQDGGNNLLVNFVAQISSLKEENGALELKVNQAYDQADELRKISAQVSLELKNKATELGLSNGKVDELRQEIQDLLFNGSAANAKILNLEATNDDLSKDLSDLRVKCTRLQEEIQRKSLVQQKRDDVINELNIENANKDRMILELKDALRTSASQNTELNCKFEMGNRANVLLQEAFVKSESKNSMLLELNDSMSEKIHQLEERMTDRLQEVSNLKTSVNRLMEEYLQKEEAGSSVMDSSFADLSKMCHSSKDLLVKNVSAYNIENLNPVSLSATNNDGTNTRMFDINGGHTQICFDDDSRPHQPTQDQSIPTSGYSPQPSNDYNPNSQSNSNTPNSKKSKSNNPSKIASPVSPAFSRASLPASPLVTSSKQSQNNNSSADDIYINSNDDNDNNNYNNYNNNNNNNNNNNSNNNDDGDSNSDSDNNNNNNDDDDGFVVNSKIDKVEKEILIDNDDKRSLNVGHDEKDSSFNPSLVEDSSNCGGKYEYGSESQEEYVGLGKRKSLGGSYSQ